MVSTDDLTSLLERRRLSYYLVPLTFGYFLHYYGNSIWWFALMLISGFAVTVQYVEDEILESINRELREDQEEISDELESEIQDTVNEYSHANGWLQFETLMILVWIGASLYIIYLYLFKIEWGADFWLAALGFANIMYALGAVVDKIWAIKYQRHFLSNR